MTSIIQACGSRRIEWTCIPSYSPPRPALPLGRDASVPPGFRYQASIAFPAEKTSLAAEIAALAVRSLRFRGTRQHWEHSLPHMKALRYSLNFRRWRIPSRRRTPDAMAKTTSPAYEQRLVLFLDFLGFKELVERTVAEPAFLPKLVGAMEIVGGIGKDDIELLKSQQITQFSDSIVISYHIDETSAVFWLLADIALGVVSLAENGFLVRGALTVGELYHSDRHVVGPAMVEAYRLESQVANVPRVIIDEKVIAVARRSRSDMHTPKDEEDYVRAFMTKDADGLHYFDYVSWKSVIDVTGGEGDGYGVYLWEIGKLVKAGLSHTDPHVQEKYLWLHLQYVTAIELVCSLPQDNAFRLENPDLCDGIERFARHDDLAQTARDAVKAYQAKKKV